MIEFTTAKESDLKGILDLQSQNLKPQLTIQDIEHEGFVTVIHTLPLLQKMNDPFPHIIAQSDGMVVGYALVMLPNMKDDVPILSNLFKQLQSISVKGEPFLDSKYFIMGQICISKLYRKQGIFKGLYLEMKQKMSTFYDFVVTEVAVENQRSLQAHHATGFKTIKCYQSENGKFWEIVLLDLKQ